MKLHEIVKSVAGRNNAVYTPISSHKQSERFGIYVSPKMITHAFVGPFRAMTTNDGGETPAAPDTVIPKIHQGDQHRAAAIRLKYREGHDIDGDELLRWASTELREREKGKGKSEVRYIEVTDTDMETFEMEIEIFTESQIIKTALENCGIGCTTQSVLLSNVLALFAEAQRLQSEGLLQLEVQYGFVRLQDLVTGQTPTLLRASAPGRTALQRKRTLSQRQSTEGTSYRNATDNWPPTPPQQHYANKSGSRDDACLGSAAAGHRAIDRQRPQPNRPPELKKDYRTNRGARHMSRPQ